MMSQRDFETITKYATYTLNVKSGFRFFTRVQLQLQLQLQLKTLKLKLKLKIDSEGSSETGFKNFVKFRIELSISEFLLDAIERSYGALKSISARK